MSYSGNMPDWHQYNPPQHGRTSTTSSGQNVNSNHLFLSNINPTALDTINLSTNERQNKHQQRNEINYPGRNYPTSGISGQNCATSSSSGVHTMAPLSSCVGHYGTSPSRNPMIEGMAATMDPRLAPPVVPLNETDLSQRNNPMSFNPSTNHTTSSNMGGIHGSMTSQTSPVGPMSPGRQGPPYGACKGPCCNPDASLAAYQHWEKYGHYQANTAYRDNMRPGHYPIENRRYAPPDMNIRKECIDNKELVASGPFGVDNRRNYPEYKYRKDLSRNYPASGLLQTYPMQNYNFPDYQKCPYSVKDYLRRGNANGPTINSQNSPLIPKYPEQQSLIVQQKYNGKQLSYHNGVQQSTVPNTSTANLPSPLQNSYYNTQMPSREVPRDFSRDYQDTNTAGNRLPTSTSALHNSYQKYHVYQQKIVMQRYSIENHLRMMSRIPGYQSHPKYQEYMMKYRELARLQQNVDYQGLLQESSKLPSPSGTQIAPINLQFDQNGVLINSNYNPGHFSGMHNAINPITHTDNPENLEMNQANMVSGGSIEQHNHFVKHTDQSLNLSRDPESIRMANKATRDQYLMQKNNEHSEQFENLMADVDELNGARAITTAINTMATSTMTIDNANSREFANKPELDVRQFLATWDESEDEETMATNLSLATTNNSPSVVTQNRSPVIKNNHSEVIEKPPEETNTTEKTLDAAAVVDANIVVDDGVENIEVTDLKTIEELANSGTIVQCIQTDIDDIPTIHIVDRMPNESELTTIQTVYRDVASMTIDEIAKAPIEILNETADGTETITLYEADSGVCTKDPECNDIPDDDEVGDEAVVEANVSTINDKPVERIEASKPSPETVVDQSEKPLELRFEKSSTQSENVVDNSTQGIDLTIKNHHANGERSNLRKQHSFASEESHNPDDISLPDLPMSECTPISTTLNTPIHSDSEESTEHVANLEISTNPIEIIPNSPIISFTHSPIKIDPYGNLDNDRILQKRPHDSLDFDFHQEESSKNKYSDDISDKTAVENFEIARRSTEPIVEQPVRVETATQNDVPSMNTGTTTVEEKSLDKDEEFYPCSDPLVGMGQNSSMVAKQNPKNSPAIGRDNSNNIIPAGECSVESLSGNTVPGMPVSRILSPDEIDTGKCPSIIDTEDFQPSDDLDKLCNMSLDDACMMSLMNEDNSRESQMQSAQLDDHSFTKVMDNILPISDLNVLESSDDEADKDDDDAWVEVRSLDGSIAAELSANEVVNSTENCGEKSPNNQEQIHSNVELENKFDDFNAIENTTNHQKTVTNWSQYTKFKHNSQNDSHSTKSNEEKAREDRPKYVPSIFDVSGDSQSTDFDKFDRKKQELTNVGRLKPTREYREEKSGDKLNLSDQYNSDSHSQSKNTKISDCSMGKIKAIESHTRISCDTNHEEIIFKKQVENLNDEKSSNYNCDTLRSLDNYETSCTITKSFRRARKETDVQIQVANINMDQTSDDDGEGGFEIKINVSRSEKNRRVNKEPHQNFNETTEVIRKRAFILSDTSTHSYPGSIFNQRRLSMPEELELKRPKKTNKDMKRRHSGGHNFKSYYRRSIGENSTDGNDGIRNFDAVSNNFTLPTVSEKEISSKEDSKQNSMSITAPPSSQDDSQESNIPENIPPISTFNDSRVNSEDESEFNEVPEVSKESKRKSSIDVTDANISHSNINDLTNIVSRSSFDITPGPSNATSSDPWNKPSFFAESTSTLDFDNFDVAPNEFRVTPDPSLHTDDDEMYSRSEKELRSKRLDDIERYRNPYSTSKPQVVDAMEMNLNSVPVYRTKDGKITWSPNPRYTYKALIMEARQREGYPAIEDLHYSSRSSRYYHEKRFYKRRQESPVKETKTWNENINYNAKKFKLPLDRRRFDDSEWTNTTCRSINNRYDNKRRERNIEIDCVKDDRSKIYSDISMPQSLCSIDSSFKAQHYRYSPAVILNIKQLEKQNRDNFEPTLMSRTKNDSNPDGHSAIENTIGDSLTNHCLRQNSEMLDGTKCNESMKIYNGEELELFSRNVSNISSEVIAKETMGGSSTEVFPKPDNRLSPLKQNFVTEENERAKNQNNWTVPHSINVTMTDDESKDISRNSMVIMQPPASVDVEQDSQAMLTDSGLASSTCTEGSKEPKRGSEQWEKALRDHDNKMKSPKNICATPQSPQHVIENKTNTFINSEDDAEVTDNFTMSEVSRQTEAAEVESTKAHDNQYQNDNEVKMIEAERFNRIPTEDKKPKKCVDIAKLTELFLSKNHGKNIESSTLNGLDLAFPARKIPVKKSLIQMNVESIPEDLTVKTQEDESKPASIFNNEHGSKFSSVTKTDEGPPRRASSDEVESRKRNSLFFEHITTSIDPAMSISLTGTDCMSSIAGRNIFDKNIGMRESHEVATRTNDGTELLGRNRLVSEIPSHREEYIFEKPEIPLIRFGPFNNPAQKINDIENSEVSTESESHYDDTLSSTQFGSECANSKSNETNTSSATGINFLSASSQEAIDATDLNQVRKNLALCALNDKSTAKSEHSRCDIANSSQIIDDKKLKCVDIKKEDNHGKILTFSGRISSESEDDSNAQDGSPIGNDNTAVINLSTKPGKETNRILNFSGRIPSPETQSGYHLPKQLLDAKEHRIPSSNIVTVNDEKNLTFAGKIQSERCKSPCISPPITEKIPKFIIKKTDSLSKSSSISQIFSSQQVTEQSIETKASSSHTTSLHPKIPKMIIRNVRSRPVTPTIEENAVELSFPKSHDSEQKVFEVKIKLDDTTIKHEVEASTVRQSIGVIECKIPKMKIKLEDRIPKMIFKNARVEMFNNNESESSKNNSKVKIRKIKRSNSKEEKSTNKVKEKTQSNSEKSERNNTAEKSRESGCSKSLESNHRGEPPTRQEIKQEKIPKLKIKKHDARVSSTSPESGKRKHSKSPTESSQRNQKKSSSRHRNSESKSTERPQTIDTDGNTSQSNSEKIPKVIIKRTSPSAEFKCELSKDGTAAMIQSPKWQPEVKLERFKVLDSIAMSPGRVKLPSKMLEIISKEKEKSEAYISSRRGMPPLHRSPSTGKRRHSDSESLTKPEKAPDNCDNTTKNKTNTIRRLDYDSDSEIFPRIIRRNGIRRIHDDSSLEEIPKPKITSLIDSSKITMEKTATNETTSQSLFEKPREIITQSEFEFTSASSSHKKINNSITNESTVSTLVTEIVDDVIVDTKHHTTENFEEPESVIKLESSDESQTTIEILPASPDDISQPESEVPTPLEGKRRIANGDMAQLYSEDAIPTQFELELEIVDNSSESLDVPVPLSNIDCGDDSRCVIAYTSPKNINEKRNNWSYPVKFTEDTTVCTTSTITPGPSFLRKTSEEIDKVTTNQQMRNICCSDSLVKEVLAAKETLKRCLAISKHESKSKCPLISRPKTAAEKKQGAVFNLTGVSLEKCELEIKKNHQHHHHVFQESNATSCDVSRNDSIKSKCKKVDRRHSKSAENSSATDRREKRSKITTDVRRHEESISMCDPSSRDETLMSNTHSSIRSLKRSRLISESNELSNHPPRKIRPPSTSTSICLSTENTQTKASETFSKTFESVRRSKDSESQPCASPSTVDRSSKMSTYKIPKISKSQESRKSVCEVKIKPMPILEPVNQVEFDAAERDTSRSPPVITKQDSSNEISPESPKKVEEKGSEKIETIMNQETEAVTFADIVAQMAYHEKATIKHRRYCILCERWFPTAARHRRHLTGYQHRHTELTQRRTVHALFMLFTGKPCPRLLPASIVRTDCAPGEPTPLQIAVQDVAISLEAGANDKTKNVSGENK